MKKIIENILFIEVKSPFNHIFSRTAIPRLGSILLATILHKRGFNTKVIIEDYKMFNMGLLKNIDMVAISTITSTAPRAFDIADRCAKRGIPVVMGGPHVTFLPDEALLHADYVVRGEGEHAMVALVEAINNNAPLDKIESLSYKLNGEPVHNPIGGFIKDLDELPMPDFSLVEGRKASSVIPFATSRGCPFKCKFCSVIKMFGTKMRYHSVDRVIEELKIYSNQTHHIFFCDDNFTANKERAKEILRRMIKEKIKIQWSAQVRVEAAKDAELLALMRKTQCFNVFIGFESVNPKTLLEYDKKQSMDDIKFSIKQFHKHKIHIHGMFVLGAKDDSVYTVQNTAKFAKTMRLDSVQFLILTPLPGTETYYEMEEKGMLITKDWRLYDSHHVVYKPENMSPYELQVGSFNAMRKFYSIKASLRHLLNLNLFYSVVHLYGIRSIRKAFKDNAQFILKLRDSLYEEARKIRGHLSPKPKRIKSVIIPEGVLTGGEQKHFSLFMQNIGVSVQFIKARLTPAGWRDDIAAYLRANVNSFRKRAGVIMIPITDKYTDMESAFAEVRKDKFRNIKEIKLIPFNVNETHRNFYDFCMSFGLALDKKLRKINKAYFQAQEKSGV